jgi:hypothetical protein
MLKRCFALMSPAKITACVLMLLKSHRYLGFALGISGTGGPKAFAVELVAAKIVVARNLVARNSSLNFN